MVAAQWNAPAELFAGKTVMPRADGLHAQACWVGPGVVKTGPLSSLVHQVMSFDPVARRSCRITFPDGTGFEGSEIEALAALPECPPNC